MFVKHRTTFIVIIAALMQITGCTEESPEILYTFPDNVSRTWIGPEFYANRLQDWQLENGRIECIESSESRPMRVVHLLTHSLADEEGSLEMSVDLGTVDPGQTDETTWAGFLVGAGGEDVDYRLTALVHHKPAEGGGLFAGIDGTGQVVFRDNTNGGGENNPWSITGPLDDDDMPLMDPVAREAGEPIQSLEAVRLVLEAEPSGTGYAVTVAAYDTASDELISQASLEDIPAYRLEGSLALVSHSGPEGSQSGYWFDNWFIESDKLWTDMGRKFGPVMAVQYTLSDSVLNLTAQFPPLGEQDAQSAELQLFNNNTETWSTAATADIIDLSYTAPFSIQNFSAEQNTRYRITYNLAGEPEIQTYVGTIKKNPVDRDEVRIAAFTGNKIFTGGLSWNHMGIWFPHNELVAAVAYHQPDLLFFSGDQVYEGDLTGAQREPLNKAMLDYLDKWYRWCWAFGDLTRDIPTVTIPDDHDVYHGNIWGACGKAPRDNPPDGDYPDHYEGFEAHYRQDGGGYLMDPSFVNMVQRTQTSHLPEPYDPTPVDQGIDVYYTDITYGGISIAVLEDRKWKNSPSIQLPDQQVVNGFSQDPDFNAEQADVPGADLLGERQLEFIQDWAADWHDAYMKVALSQTIFANIATYPVEFETDAGTTSLEPLPQDSIPPGYDFAEDMDSNGWPQSGRNRALAELRKGFTFHIAGDQHLGSTIHYGIDDWHDAGFAVCVPSIGNTWPRRWYPPYPGKSRDLGSAYYTGNYEDGFGNLVTVLAVSNPVKSGREPANLYDRAPGYGIVHLNKDTREITVEVWPRWVNPANPDAEQYHGWPIIVNQLDNYGKEPVAYLPYVEADREVPPVLQVVDELSGEIVYTVRLNGQPFRPKVFRNGTYTVRLGDGDRWERTWNNVRSIPAESDARLDQTFSLE